MINMIKRIFEQKKKLILIFLFLLFPALSFTQMQVYQEYKDYTIIKGDTLWDISQKELNDPFLWPKIWKENPEIKNPDIIYPSKRIKIPLYLLQKEIPAEKPKPMAVKKPEIIEEKPVEEKIGPKEIEYLVDKNILIASGYIADSVPEIGVVIDSPTDRTILGHHDYAYIKTNKPVNIGDKFYIINVVKKIKHPDSGRKLGYLIEILGVAEVVENTGDPKVLITTSYGEIEQEALLDNYYEIKQPLAIESPRKPDLDGYIVAARQLRNISGTWDIVYTDKGRKDGLKVGDLLATTLKSKHKIYTGVVQIINLGESTSTAIVRKSNREIKQGDRIAKAK